MSTVESAAPLEACAQRLRVAVVTPELHRTGGTERGTAELLARLAAEHEVCLYAHHWIPDGGQRICFHSVPVLPWPGMARFLSFFWLASAAVLRGERKHGAYDCVYSPGPNCLQVNVSTAWFCQARQWDLLRSGHFRPATVTWEDRLRLYHRFLSAACNTWLEKWFYLSPGLQRVICPAEVVRRDLNECYRAPLARLAVAHCGVDGSTFNPAARARLRDSARGQLGLAPGEFSFLFVGTDWVRKSMLTVLDALREVPGARLLAVGPYDPAAYHRYAQMVGVADRVSDPRRRSDILFYYAAADALVAPSFYEPFGMVPLEAVACGVPVIITRQMGVAEILDEESALVLDDSDDPHALALAMSRIMREADLRERLTLNGSQRAHVHSWDGICQATLTAIRDAASARKASRNGMVGA